ncbi:MAG: folylpolyglutamate synthase/dihydrofolate synthase family protein [Acidobacteriota bacterium]
MPPPSVPALSSPDQLLSRLERLGIRLGLESFRRLCTDLGDPQLRFRSVLVAGSNGKGSTSSFLAAMARAAGLKTGFYSSPHLESVRERIRIDGRCISEEDFGRDLERVVRTAPQEPTYFEAVTAAAFLAFASEEVDLAVVEVGMGGRLDATNVCEPLLSLVTSVSLEHQEHLGDTLALIAREKAGIFRPGRPALAWVEEPEAAESLRKVADEVGAGLRFGQDLATVVEVVPEGWGGQRIRLMTPKGEHDLRTDLPGAHQVRNLGLAVLAAEELGLAPQSISQGARTARWPGRLERIELPDGGRVLLDAAHNDEGAGVLAGFLATLPGKADLLFGVLADKDVSGMIGRLAPLVDRIVLTTPPSDRARRPEEVAVLLPGRAVEMEPDLGAALDRAFVPGGTLVACGSIFLVGEVRKRLRERFGVPGAATEPL